MTGAHSFVADGNSLIFKVPSHMCRQHIAGVKITLTGNDDYNMEFGAFKGSLTKGNYRYEVVARYSGVYDTELALMFEDATGLRTNL
jgi:hypothetical protein